MNAKEAREILKKDLADCERSIDFFENGKAKGFLEAVDKFKPVVAEIEMILKGGDNSKGYARIALEAYKRDVLGQEQKS